MRNILIVLNCVLGFALAGVTFRTLFFARRAEVQAAKPVNKKAVLPVKRTVSGRKKTETPPPADELIKTITAANIFNSSRSPNSGMRGRGGNTTLTLVGTFRIGNTEGAIIKVKGAQNRFASFGGFPGMMGGGMMMPPPMMMQNQGGGNNNNNNNSGSFRGGRGSGGRRRFGSMFGMMGNMQQNSNNNNSTTGVKQYVKVGETLSTGHTLVEVTRFKAVLTRGGSKTELNLEDPSRTRRKPSRPKGSAPVSSSCRIH